jgi:hypothetical protein
MPIDGATIKLLLISAAVLAAALIVWFYLIPWIKGLYADLSGEADQLATGQTPTLSNTSAQAIADAIFSDCGELYNDNTDLETQFALIKNDADFALVKKLFGVQSWALGLKSGDMLQFLTAFVSGSEITKINQILTNNQVKSQI